MEGGVSHMTVKALPKPRKGAAKADRTTRRRATQGVLRDNAAKVLERDGYRCRVCGLSWGLQVHHVTFRSQGGGHETSNLVTLCGLCHTSVHDRRMRIEGDADGDLAVRFPSVATTHIA